jgi:hypothetical protein
VARPAKPSEQDKFLKFMKQFRILSNVMETGDHSKNGVSSKDHTSRGNRRYRVGGLVIACALALLMSSCATVVKWQDMKLGNVNVRSRVYNLQNATFELDPELSYQIERIMSNIVDTRGEQMGYYTVNFTYTSQLTPGGSALAFISGFTMFTLNLVGMPIQMTEHTVSAYLNIFDSQGNLVERFRKSDKIKLTSGFYYGHDLTEKAEKKYTELFRILLQQVDMKSNSINDLLEKAGTVTKENTASAKSKIAQTKIP